MYGIEIDVYFFVVHFDSPRLGIDTQMTSFECELNTHLATYVLFFAYTQCARMME